ncbi:3-dehydroquinate synthase, partial [Haemophilus influenzae]
LLLIRSRLIRFLNVK